jgi:hypothetical protein
MAPIFASPVLSIPRGVDESRHELLGTFGTCHGLIRNPKPPLLGCVFPLANEGGGSSLSGLAEGKTVLVAGQGRAAGSVTFVYSSSFLLLFLD